MALAPFAFKMLIGICLGLALGESVEDIRSNTEMIAEDGMEILLISALALAPIVETLIFQWLLIWLISIGTKRISVQVILSASIFALMHLPYGIVAFAATFPPGIFMAWCFIEKRNYSRWRACWTTASVHCLHNAISVVVFAALRT